MVVRLVHIAIILHRIGVVHKYVDVLWKMLTIHGHNPSCVMYQVVLAALASTINAACS